MKWHPNHKLGCVAILGVSVSLLLSGANILLADGDTDEFRPRRVVKPQPTITEIKTKSVSDVGDDLNPSELVIGVTVGKESRAYPINMLTGPRREILNDTLGGRAIAATW